MGSKLSQTLYRVSASGRRFVGQVRNLPYFIGVLALAGAWLARPDPAGHGLRAVYSTGDETVERVAFVTANNRTPADAALTVQWSGYLYLPQAGEVVLRVPGGVDARLEIDGQPIYETDIADAPPNERVPLQLSAGAHPLRLEITTPVSREVYFQAGLEWWSPLGWQLVPAAYLYSDAPDPALAAAAINRANWALALTALAAACGLLLAARWAWAKRHCLTSRTGLGLAALVVLTLGLRLLVLRDLTSPPNADVFPQGADHRGYHESAFRVLRGTWVEGDFRVQPGMTLTLSVVYAIFGPHIRAAQALQMLLGALATALIFDVARRIFGQPAGWLAAGLWAIFPLPIFYEAQLLTHGLEAVSGVLILWLWVRLAAAPRLGRIVALGLALGVAAVLRPTFLALAPLAALSVTGGEWRSGHTKPLGVRIGKPVLRVLLLALAVLIPIAPITWSNYRIGGDFQLISSNNDVTLYLGNNRDATGLGEYTPAYWATHARVNRGDTTYLRQTFVEIGDEPVRWLQLMARKVALYLGDPELPNNVDFYAEGLARSALLRALPLRFGAMMALALAGAALALAGPLRRDVRLWIVLAYAAAQIAVTVAYHVFSRFRAPIYPALAILAGWALADVYARLRRRTRRGVGVGLAALAASGGLIALMPLTAERVMSLPIVRALPAGSRELNAPIGEALTLVGYDALPAVEPGEPAFVTLYWRANEPLPPNLYATVQVVADLAEGEKLAQADQAIGTGSFPIYPTGRWQSGEIVSDRYLLLLPDDAPAPRALTVLVAAYNRSTGERLGEATFGPLPVTYARPLDVPPADAMAVGAKVGAATLTAYRVSFDPGTLTLTLYWTADDPMAEDGVVFVHLFNAAGQFVLGQDGRPMNGLYSTQAWQKGEGVVDEHVIALPADLPPGEYRVNVGMYDAVTQARLPVLGADGQPVSDGSLPLGNVVLK